MKEAEMTDKTFPGAVSRGLGLPAAQGLYSPAYEHDSCGVGFVADMQNRKSHGIVAMGLQILLNLNHRGAVGADPDMGDGCGMLVQIPHKMFAAEQDKLGFALPPPGEYAVGAFFLPRDPEGRQLVEAVIERAIAAEGLSLLGWRATPVDSSCLGKSVRETEPVSRQAFIQRGPQTGDQTIFERRLYILRKVISNAVYGLNNPRTAGFYPVSLLSISASQRIPFPHGRSPIPTAMWRTTARSTRCGAISTGWPPVRLRSPRLSLAVISASFGRFHTKASPTPPVSITHSNSSSRAAIRSPMR